MSDFDCGEMDGKIYPLSDIALYYLKINSMLHSFETRVILLAIIEHALSGKLDQMDFELGGKHHAFLQDLVRNNILIERPENFVFNECFISVLIEFNNQNNIRKILRENIFERVKIPKNLSLSITYFNSRTETYSKDGGDEGPGSDDDIDPSLNIFKFLKTL
ncbi:hypothetical protein EBU94_02595 [bacterium]|jgi:hypothetical protein|nr:hypothetical protein [bacterium]